MSIVEFLNARLDEDAAKFGEACEAEAERCRNDGIPDMTAAEVEEYWVSLGEETPWPRRQREVSAKRAIVKQYVLMKPFGWPEGVHETLALNLNALASVYSDHEDYRQEWAL